MDLENLKAHFWDGTYVDKSENGKNTLKQCYFNEEGIKIAIKRALGDFTDRTEKLTTESGGKSLGVEENSNCYVIRVTHRQRDPLLRNSLIIF